jgi:hypothetical protein
MVEKYIKKSISRPQIYIDRIMQANLLPGASINSSTKNKTKADLTLQTKQIRLKKIM